MSELIDNRSDIVSKRSLKHLLGLVVAYQFEFGLKSYQINFQIIKKHISLFGPGRAQFPLAQATMRFSPGVLLLVFSLQQILALNPEVSIKKCCPEGQIYNSATKLCVQGTGINL